jgi:hypothetical protein
MAQVFTRDITTAMIVTPDTYPTIAKFAESQGRTLDDICFMHMLQPEKTLLRERMQLRGDDGTSIERRIADCLTWDDYVRSLKLPTVYLSNLGTLADLEKELALVIGVAAKPNV